MTTVNMLAAKTQLSRLVKAIETRAEREIIIARNGKPAAKLVPLAPPPVDVSKRIGIAEGLFVVPDDFDADNAEIEKLFNGETT
jgi:antitoxin (DNA-binding transcriptional repressor) of toxin-antitoxin stability system